MKYPYKKLEISVRIRSSSVRIKFYLSAFALVLILFIGCIKYQHLKNRAAFRECAFKTHQFAKYYSTFTIPYHRTTVRNATTTTAPNRIVSKWTDIGDPKYRVKFYSAFFDTRIDNIYRINDDGNIPWTGKTPVALINIIGILPIALDKKTITCHYLYKNQTVTEINTVEVRAVQENYGLKYSAFVVSCPIYLGRDINQYSFNDAPVELPESVSLSHYSFLTTELRLNFIQIAYNRRNTLLFDNQPNKNLAVCVGPVQNNFSDALRLVEFIEFYRILGVENFYFYYLSSTDDVRKVLHYYKSIGVATLLEWNLYDYEFEKELRYGGIFAALQDCLHRSIIDGYEFITVADIDEILMVYKTDTLVKFLNSFRYFNESIETFKYDEFIFRGGMFYDTLQSNWDTVPYGTKNQYLRTQVQVERVKDIYEYHYRSKYIARSLATVELGNHYVNIKFVEREYLVPIDEGLLHHYRINEIHEGPRLYGKIYDSRARKYGPIIWKAVEHICNEIFLTGVCPTLRIIEGKTES